MGGRGNESDDDWGEGVGIEGGDREGERERERERERGRQTD